MVFFVMNNSGELFEVIAKLRQAVIPRNEESAFLLQGDLGRKPKADSSGRLGSLQSVRTSVNFRLLQFPLSFSPKKLELV